MHAIRESMHITFCRKSKDKKYLINLHKDDGNKILFSSV